MISGLIFIQYLNDILCAILSAASVALLLNKIWGYSTHAWKWGSPSTTVPAGSPTSFIQTNDNRQHYDFLSM